MSAPPGESPPRARRRVEDPPRARGRVEDPPRYETRRSPIHGRGVFALRRFRPGARIGCFEGVRTRRDGPHVLWTRDERDRVYAVRGTGPLRFLNHSARPNAEFEGTELYAIRNIQPGSEITLHYGEEWQDVP